MIRVASALVLALCLFGCSSTIEPSAGPSEEPSASGEPIGVVGYGMNGQMPCQGQRAEGSLRADVALENRITHTSQGPVSIEIWPLDTVVWPSGIEPERFVALRWPLEYTGVRLADGEVAVLDGDGHRVATTGRNYRLIGEWAVIAAIGGPLFGKPPWIDAFNVCRGSEAVVRK